MDPDQRAEPELDRFSLYFPLPYRVAVVLVLGVWGWGLNLHYLSAVKIDVAALIRYPSRSSLNQVPLHRSTYHLATLLTIPLAVSLLFFWAVTHGSPKLVLAWEILPQSYLLIFLVLLTLPLHKLSRAGRHRFLVALKRVSVGGLAEAHDGKFGDIILADVVTSYARVLGDFFVSVCMFVTPGVSSTNYPDRSCGGDVAVPLIVSIPSLIRLRQCLIEYSRVRKSGHQVEGWGGQHLANALKYASALPVYIVRALYRRQHSHNAGMGMAGLHRLWILFTFINSLYSFYWDVAKDWELSLFSPNERDDPDYPIGLRRHRFFHANEMYYGAITVDFLLRFAWVLRWSARTDDLESEIFALIMLEVIRRWMWIFLRIETEWAQKVRNNRSPAADDILLGDYNGKIDED